MSSTDPSLAARESMEGIIAGLPDRIILHNEVQEQVTIAVIYTDGHSSPDPPERIKYHESKEVQTMGFDSIDVQGSSTLDGRWVLPHHKDLFRAPDVYIILDKGALAVQVYGRGFPLQRKPG
jgi:hypothetical protein